MIDILPRFQQYAWFFPTGTIVAFIMGAGMGANELSSNWGSVFGSRVLKLWQIILIGAVFEFSGAMLVGESVASAIKDGILDRRQFLTPNPEVLMLAFLVVLITAGIWLVIANYFAVPVSDSQTTVMALVGVGLAFNPGSIIVGASVFSSRGLLKIISAWVVSPISALLIGIALYMAIKNLLLIHSKSTSRALKTFPFFIFLTVFINFWFFLLETDLQPWGEELEWWHKLVGGLIGGAVVTVIAQFTYVKWLAKRIEQIRSEGTMDTMMNDALPLGADDEKKAPVENGKHWVSRVDKALGSSFITKHLVKDYHAEAMQDETTRHVYEEAAHYPEEMEFLFSHLLIMTACFKSFAHGASDVGNTIGPLAGIIEILTTGTTADKADFPEWIKAVGAASMAVGIITFGYRTLVTLGVKVTRLSPAKGLAIDLASSLVVIITAYLKIPISSTQTQVGAIIGVSLVSGTHSITGTTNWKTITLIVLVWLANLGVSLSLAYGVFQFVARSPKIV